MTEREDEGDVLHRYACLRFERLIKLTRASVRCCRDGGTDEAALFHLIRIYADLLGQSLLTGSHSQEAEMRLTVSLQDRWSGPDEVGKRVQGLADRLQSDWTCASDLHSGPATVQKRGVIGFSSVDLAMWAAWIGREAAPAADVLGVILARGLTEGALLSRILRLPMRFLVFSRARLGMDSALPIEDAWWTGRSGQRVLLVDAHSASGETLRACRGLLASLGHRVVAALVTDYEGSPQGILGLEELVAGPLRGPLVLRPTQASRSHRDLFQPRERPAPLIVLAGKPGAGKTMVRKGLQALTGWPIVSWSRAVRSCLDDMGGVTWEAVTQLEKAEARDPEFVVREILRSPEFMDLPAHAPVVIDGVKSQRGLDTLVRFLGRPAQLLWVRRDAELREDAVRERADFDDGRDTERRQQLHGLAELSATASLIVDTSDSSVDSKTGYVNLGHATAAALQQLLNACGCPPSPPSRRRESAKWTLYAPGQREVLILRSAKTRKWVLPGGGLETGEAPIEAAERELEEETALRIPHEGIRVLGSFRTGVAIEGVPLVEDHVHLFWGTSVSRQVILSSEHVEFMWAGEDQAREFLPRVWRGVVEVGFAEWTRMG